MENSVSSLAYRGSISVAIAEAKNQKKLFVVFISGDDAESRRLESSTWTDSKVGESVSKYCILLHLTERSSEATQFSAIFPQKVVPCITAVGFNGLQLWQNEGFIAAEDLSSTLEKLWLSLHLQDTTAAVLSAALASKNSEPSTSAPSEEGSSKVSTQSSSTLKHGEPSSAKTENTSKEAKAKKNPTRIVEEKKASKRGDMSSKSVEAKGVKVGGDENLADVASRSIKGSRSSDKGSEPQSSSTEVNVASRDLSIVHLNIRMPDGVNLQEKFSVTSTLRVVKDYVDEHQETVMGPYDLAVPYPRKVYNVQDLERTLSELGLLDRQALTVVPRQGTANQQPSPETSVESTNESSESYFGYAKRVFSFVNPLSYLGGGSTSTNSGQQSRRDSEEYGSNSMNDNNRFAQTQRASYMGNQSSSSMRQRIPSRFGSNIHTLKHYEDESDDGPSRDDNNNTYWNGNSTQYGGNDDNGEEK